MFRFLAAFFLLPLPLLWTCAWAIHQGIASARDEHHRMTPQSPWYFFDAILKQYIGRITLAVVVIIAFPIIEIVVSDLPVTRPINELQVFSRLYLNHFACLLVLPFFGIAFSLWYAPSTRNHWTVFISPTLVGAFFASLAAPIPYFARELLDWNLTPRIFTKGLYYVDATNGLEYVIPLVLLPELLAMIGLLGVTASIIRARFVLGEQWFFPNNA